MKEYALVNILPRFKFNLGMLEFVDGARPMYNFLNMRLENIKGIWLVENDYEQDVRDLLDGSEDASARFVARHWQSMQFDINATLGIGRPAQKELYYSLRTIFDEYRNWKFESAIDESKMNVETSYIEAIREIGELYTSMKTVDMMGDILDGYFREKVAAMVFDMLREAFNPQLELFNSMYDGVIRGAKFNLVDTGFMTSCILQLSMEKDDSV